MGWVGLLAMGLCLTTGCELAIGTGSWALAEPDGATTGDGNVLDDGGPSGLDAPGVPGEASDPTGALDAALDAAPDVASEATGGSDSAAPLPEASDDGCAGGGCASDADPCLAACLAAQQKCIQGCHDNGCLNHCQKDEQSCSDQCNNQNGGH